MKFYPDIKKEYLIPGFAGIRPKLNYKKNTDFLVQDSKVHSIKNYINLFGIESPGLTSSFAIADLICKILKKWDLIMKFILTITFIIFLIAIIYFLNKKKSKKREEKTIEAEYEEIDEDKK